QYFVVVYGCADGDTLAIFQWMQLVVSFCNAGNRFFTYIVNSANTVGGINNLIPNIKHDSLLDSLSIQLILLSFCQNVNLVDILRFSLNPRLQICYDKESEKDDGTAIMHNNWRFPDGQ